MKNDNDENKDISSFPRTGSKPLLPTLNNIKVTKSKVINNSTFTKSQRTGSSASTRDREKSGRRLPNSQKEKIANSCHKKHALSETDAEQTDEGFVSVSIDVHNSLKKEFFPTKRVCEELCDTIAL